LLDTNIVSEASKPRPSIAVADWIVNEADSDLFISTLTIAEIWRGVLETASVDDGGIWRRGLSVPRGPLRSSPTMAAGTAVGRPRSPIDMIIAATAAANSCVVVTVNERHFRGVVEFLNSMQIVS
jgi:predicted nucleic acid-binding protein